MEIYFKMFMGKTIALNVEPSYYIEQIKEMLQDKEGIPPDEQILTLDGKLLEDGTILYDYDIYKDGTLNFFLKIKSG
jgi:Ubiquitin family